MAACRGPRAAKKGYCLACHGPDETTRKAKLRLDARNVIVKKDVVQKEAAKSPLSDR